MSEYIKAADALADYCGGLMGLFPDQSMGLNNRLNAYQKARKGAESGKVKPLVWRDEGVRYVSGKYEIEICGIGERGIWRLTFYGAEIAVSSAKNYLSHLKRKAWEHHVSYIKAALE